MLVIDREKFAREKEEERRKKREVIIMLKKIFCTKLGGSAQEPVAILIE
jgi:hypothetical protein